MRNSVFYGLLVCLALFCFFDTTHTGFSDLTFYDMGELLVMLAGIGTMAVCWFLGSKQSADYKPPLGNGLLKIANKPAPPVTRFICVLLLTAEKQGAKEIRFALDSDTFTILFDATPQPAPAAKMYQPTVEMILGFAGIRLSPSSKSVSGERLDVENEEDGKRSSWLLESADLANELILKRVAPSE